jgi:hypothetical protein
MRSIISETYTDPYGVRRVRVVVANGDDKHVMVLRREEAVKVVEALRGAFADPDKDPLPQPSLRNEIDELRQRLTRLEELIAIV